MTPLSTISQLIKLGEQMLTPMSDSAKLDSQILLGFVLQKTPSYFLTWPEKKVAEASEQAFLKLLKRREQHEPIAYIVGEKEFWSMPFKVSPSTLIPRPDTEVLVETVLQHHSSERVNCCDLGTGTGAIALSLASERPLWQIDAIDFSQEAVALAQENANNLGYNEVAIYQSNWFSKVNAEKRFNVIVSNPPYIDETDPHLSDGDVQFEPLSALVANKNGLGDIIDIAQAARHFLAINGMIYFEHGYNQGGGVRDVLTDLGYKNIQTINDYNGHERITIGQLLTH